jgi:toxic protein SymE
MKSRVLKISNVLTFGKKEIPQIRIQGIWLKKLGFSSGNKVKVEESTGKLVIRLKTSDKKEVSL